MKHDNYTSTVDGAEGFERMYGDHFDDTPTNDELARENYEESDEYDDGVDDDACNCSDPGCPCRGPKRGGV